MPTITEVADDVFRDFEIDNVASSGKSDPPKVDVRALFAQVDAEIQAAKDAADGLTFQGEWSSGTTYTIGQSVSYSGSSYASRVDANLANQPDTSTTQWQRLAGQGGAGPAGADGALIVTRWVAAVVANGGTVSEVEKAARAQFYEAIQEVGVYDLLDDFAILSSEPGVSVQALVTGKRRVLMTAMNSPIFTRRGVQFVAASSHHIKTGFVPSTHATKMDGSHMEGGVYSIENIAATTTPLGCYESTNKRFEIVARTGSAGGQYYFGFNASTAVFGTISDSIGLVSYYRNDTVYGSRKNGVAAATYVPASNATVLPGIELYIGARNWSGTADSKYSGTLAFAYWGAPLSEAQTTALYNAVQTYLVTVGALDVYVSTSSGADTNAGDVNHPYLTWDKAYGNVQAVAGVSMWLDGTAGSPQTYKSTLSSDTALSKTLTVRALNKHGAIVTSNGVTNTAVRVAPTAGETINLFGLILDPSPNASSTKIYCMQLSSMATAFRLNATDCIIRGWTGLSSSRGVYTPSASFRGHVRLYRCELVGADVESGVRIETLVEGGVELDECIFTLTDQNTVSNGPVRIVAKAAGLYARIINCVGRSTLKASLSGAGTHRGFYIEGFNDAVIRGGSSFILGPGSPRSSDCARIVPGLAADGVTVLTANDCIIEDLEFYAEPSGGGIAVGIGNDGTTDPDQVMRPIVRRVTGKGSAAAAAALLHGIFLGPSTDGLMEKNEPDTCGFGCGAKNALNPTIINNPVLNCATYGVVLKGVTGGSVKRNPITAMPGSNFRFIFLEDDATLPGSYTTGVAVEQNTFINNGQTSVKFVDIAVGSGAGCTFDKNVHLQNAGSLAAAPFNNGATTYANFAAWKAALGTTDAANFA